MKCFDHHVQKGGIQFVGKKIAFLFFYESIVWDIFHPKSLFIEAQTLVQQLCIFLFLKRSSLFMRDFMYLAFISVDCVL